MDNTSILNLRLPNSLAEALRAEKARTHEPTANFVRRAVEHALNPTVFEVFLQDAVERGEFKPGTTIGRN
jgi:predicted DNA-binding protein